MGYPVFTRTHHCNDTDSEGNYLVPGRLYDTELMIVNLPLNADFANGFDDYTIDGAAALGAQSYIDRTCVRVQAAEDYFWAVKGALFPVRRDRSYRFTFAVAASGMGGVFTWRLYWLDSAGAAIGAAFNDQAATSEDWVTITHDAGYPPAGAVYAKIWLYSAAVGIGYQAFDGYLSTIRFHSGTAGHTFGQLYADGTETLTFDSYPWAPSPTLEDDPTVSYDAGNSIVSRRLRQPRQSFSLTFAHISQAIGRGLLRWHGLTRGEVFTYADSYGRSRLVLWQGDFRLDSVAGSSLFIPSEIILTDRGAA